MAEVFFPPDSLFISVIAVMWVFLITPHCSAFPGAALPYLCTCEEMSRQGGATFVTFKIDLKAM